MPKGKRVRSVPMMPDVVSALATLKEREHFTGDDELAFVNEVGEQVETTSTFIVWKFEWCAWG